MALIITIEGTDGAGKRTQTAALKSALEKNGSKVNWFTFPQYEVSFMSRIIIPFLNGDWGSPKTYHPIVRSLMFALERFESKSILSDLAKNADYLIIDRYIGSNLAYQIADTPADRRAECVDLILGVELGILQLVPPTINFFLDVPPEVAQANIHSKPVRQFLHEAMDENERDLELLKRTYESYEYMIQNNILGNWTRVHCTSPSGDLLPEAEITQALVLALREFESSVHQGAIA